MGQGFLGQVDTAKHAGDFFYALFFAQFSHGRAGGIALANLMDKQMLMALRCHLRQVSDRQHLAAFAQAAQQLPDDLGSGAANAHVHFVEHQGRYAGGLCGDDLNGQADTRQFAARGHFGQGFERLAGVGAHQQFNVFEAEGRRVAAGLRAQFDHKAAARHAQALDLFFDGTAQACRGQVAQVAEFAGTLLIVAGIGGQLIGQTLDIFIIGVESFELIQQFLLQGGHFGGLNPMFACQGINGVEALLEILQAARVGVEVVNKAVELADGLFDLDLCAGQQVGGFAQ